MRTLKLNTKHDKMLKEIMYHSQLSGHGYLISTIRKYLTLCDRRAEKQFREDFNELLEIITERGNDEQ